MGNQITLNSDGTVKEVKLGRLSTQELEETGYAPVDNEHWVIKLDDGYYLTKNVKFETIELDN